MMNTENVKAAFADEAFVRSLLELDTVAEVQAALKEKDVELSEEEILGIRDLFLKVAEGEISVEQLESGELPEELLEQVAGGSIFLTLMGVGAVIGMVSTVGAAVTEIIHAASGRIW
jgi:hypothetical protein